MRALSKDTYLMYRKNESTKSSVKQDGFLLTLGKNEGAINESFQSVKLAATQQGTKKRNISVRCHKLFQKCSKKEIQLTKRKESKHE